MKRETKKFILDSTIPVVIGIAIYILISLFIEVPSNSIKDTTFFVFGLISGSIIYAAIKKLIKMTKNSK